MSDMDLIDKEEEYGEVEVEDEDLTEMDQIEKGKKVARITTKRQLKVRRAIEEHLEKKRFREEVDYLADEWDDDA